MAVKDTLEKYDGYELYARDKKTKERGTAFFDDESVIVTMENQEEETLSCEEFMEKYYFYIAYDGDYDSKGLSI